MSTVLIEQVPDNPKQLHGLMLASRTNDTIASVHKIVDAQLSVKGDKLYITARNLHDGHPCCLSLPSTTPVSEAAAEKGIISFDDCDIAGIGWLICKDEPRVGQRVEID